MTSIFPVSASVGQEFSGYSFDGESWNLIGNEFNPTSFSSSPPLNPKAGDLWVDSDEDVDIIDDQNLVFQNDLNDYLSLSSASTTYLTQTSASTTYQTKVANIDDTEIGYLNNASANIQTQLNSKANLSGATFSGNIIAPEVRATTKLVAQTVGGDEGGEILLGKAATNTTLTGDGVTIDVFQNRLRIFEQGGDARGGYIDVSRLGNSVSTNLTPGLSPVIPTSVSVGSGSGAVAAGGAVTFSGSSSLTVNGCFNSTYQNYKIYFSTSAGQANVELRLQLTSAGTSNSGSYLWQPSGGVGSTVESSFPLTFVQYNGVTANEFSLLQPALAVHTQYVTDWNYDDGGSIIYRRIGGKHRVNTSYDGFVITGATTMTGTIRIYGYNNG